MRAGARLKALKAAFPHTIPILTGFLFLGMTYGIFMRSSGFSVWYPLCTSLIVFGGSLEFVIVSMLLSSFAPMQTFVMALMIQARHLFYGIAMLEKYKDTGWMKPHLIFGLCDETFSINCTTEAPADVDRNWFMFFVTMLNHSYWVVGSVLGSLLGLLIPFPTEGLDFVMTAMFVVIFLEQWLKDHTHYTALIGLAASVACRLGFGADSFLIPTMVCILAMLTVFRRPIEKGGVKV